MSKNKELNKPRRQWQRERHQTKGLMSRTIAVHVRYKSLYISLPSSAKQRREMTKFCVVYRTWTKTANFSWFHLELKQRRHCIFTFSTFLESLAHRKGSRQLRISLVKYQFIFTRRCPRRRRRRLKAETHYATNCCNKSPRVTCENHYRCDRILSPRSVARIQTG